MFYLTPLKPVMQMALSMNSNKSPVTALEESWELPWERDREAEVPCPALDQG